MFLSYDCLYTFVNCFQELFADFRDYSIGFLFEFNLLDSKSISIHFSISIFPNRLGVGSTLKTFGTANICRSKHHTKTFTENEAKGFTFLCQGEKIVDRCDILKERP